MLAPNSSSCCCCEQTTETKYAVTVVQADGAEIKFHVVSRDDPEDVIEWICSKKPEGGHHGGLSRVCVVPSTESSYAVASPIAISASPQHGPTFFNADDGKRAPDAPFAIRLQATVRIEAIPLNRENQETRSPWILFGTRPGEPYEGEVQSTYEKLDAHLQKRVRNTVLAELQEPRSNSLFMSLYYTGSPGWEAAYVVVSQVTVSFDPDKPYVSILYTLYTPVQMDAARIFKETAGIFAHYRYSGDLQYSLRCIGVDVSDVAFST